MRKRISFLLSCLLLLTALVPMTLPAMATDTGEEALWSNDYYRIMDITDSLTQEQIDRLDQVTLDILQEHHADICVAVIPEARLDGDDPVTFASELYEDCDFGYGPSRDGFSCLYLEDTEVLTVVPMGGAVGLFPQAYLDFMEERIPSLRENLGVEGIVTGCQELVRTGLQTLEEKSDEPLAVPKELTPETLAPAEGDFPRCGEGSGKPVWFPADLNEAYVYFDADAPRVLDYADILSDETEAALQERIAEVSAETGKDVVVVTDMSSYGLGEDIYAADCYDYNGYGYGEEHEGILLFLNMDPEDRCMWTVETGSETRSLINQSIANRLDDFLYYDLVVGEYELAVTNWVEDVYDLFTVGLPRAPFWYPKDGIAPDYGVDPQAPVVVDEWGLLTEEQIATLKERSDYFRETYGVPVYFHTTHDLLGLSERNYNALYMASMGYEPDAVLFTVENTIGNTSEFCDTYVYGAMNERIPEKFRSRIENNASAADDGYGRLLESQRLLAAYLDNGRVPRNGFYWGLITIFALLVGLVVAHFTTSSAESSMHTIKKRTSAFNYLDRKNTSVRQTRETFLYMTSDRVYIPPVHTDSGSSSSSSGGSTYKSSYSGHSGVSHSGHGRKF